MSKIDQNAVARLLQRARRDAEAGLEWGGVEGCSVALAYQGELICEAGFGQAEANTPMVMWSLTKTVLESALWRLYGEGKIRPEDAVAKYIDGFGTHGKEVITLAMLETHTAGIANQAIEFADTHSRQKRLAAMADWRLEDVPAESYDYHRQSASWALAEIIEKVTGQDFRAYLKAEVLEPLSLAGVHGISLGEPAESHVGTLRPVNYMFGYVPAESKRLPLANHYDSVAGIALGNPGSGGVGTAAGIALLYQAYLHNSHGLWDAKVLDDAKFATRVRMPDGAGRPAQRTLSFVQAGEPHERYGERNFFGKRVSNLTFGHEGQGGQVVWADPATGLSFAYLTNTVVFPPGGHFHPRASELSDLACEVLR